MKRLYKAEVTVVAYVLLDEEQPSLWDAKYAVEEELGNSGNIEVDIFRVSKGETPDAGWADDCLVYGADKDTTLADAMKRYVPK